MTMALLLSLVIGAAVIAVALGFLLIGGQDKTQQITRRLEGSALVEEAFEKSASAQLMRDEELSTLPWLNRTLASWSRIDYVRTLLSQAGVETKPGQIILTSAVVFLGAYVVAHFIFGGVMFPLLLGIASGCDPIG